MNVAKKTAAGTWMLPKGRMSYPFLFEPSDKAKTAKGKNKYQLTLVMPKDSDLSALKKEMYAIAFDKLQDEKKAKKAVEDRFLDPTDKGMGDEFEGWTMLRLSTINRPGVVNAQGNSLNKDDNSQDVYPGRWARATCRPYWFQTQDKTNKGVTVDLVNVQLLEDDEPFAGSARVSPEDEFEPVTSGGDDFL